jgi:hypothetical protein
MKSPEAHKAMVLSMSPVLGPVPTIQPALETVEVGAAVRYDELPSGEPDWIIIVDADDSVGELKEFPKSSRLAQELLGKKVGDQFILATGFMDRKGIIRQIMPKYVRAYNLCGDSRPPKLKRLGKDLIHRDEPLKVARRLERLDQQVYNRAEPFRLAIEFDELQSQIHDGHECRLIFVPIKLFQFCALFFGYPIRVAAALQ